MRHFAVAIVFLFPTFVFAACVENGTTVVYVNGVATTYNKALDDLSELSRKFYSRTKDSSISFKTAYNASHLEGMGDVLKTWFQNRHSAGQYVDDYDLKTILLNLHSDLSTRRVLLVGHSQGSYYTNAMYNYLLAHGVPRESASVYNVATPAGFVEGGGTYLNSSGDTLLAWVQTLGFTPLAYNIDLAASDTKELYPGHSFSGAYLANAPDRIVGDIKSLVETLEPTMASERGECFSAPENGLLYQTTGVAVTAGDVIARIAKQVYGAGRNVASVAAAATKKAYADVKTTVAGIKGLSNAGDGSIESRTKNFNLIDKLYGSSLTSEELHELLGTNGGAVIVVAPLMTAPMVAGASTEEYDPAPQRRYVGKSRSRSVARESESLTVEEVSSPVVEETVEEEIESTSDEIASTTEEAEVPPVITWGSPVEDSFDASISGWTTFGHNGVLPATTTKECVSGTCIAGNAQNPAGVRMYALGAPQQTGAFTVYVKLRGGSFTPLFNPRPQIHLCVGPGSCEDGKRLVAFEHETVDNTWYRYLVAWRQGSDWLELCTLQNSTDISQCAWTNKEEWPTGSEVNGVALLSSVGYRLDLGGEFWFDELIGYTP